MDVRNNLSRKKGGNIKVFFSVPPKNSKELHVLLKNVLIVFFHKQAKNMLYSDSRIETKQKTGSPRLLTIVAPPPEIVVNFL